MTAVASVSRARASAGPAGPTGSHPARSRARALRPAVAGLALTLALGACAGGGGTGGSAAGPPSSAAAGGLEGDVVVFAAASLTDALTEVARGFEAAHPGVRVTLSFGASSALAQQIVSGAPADVFAAASPATMAQVVEAGGAAGEPTVVVRNRLQIAVPAGNPAQVRGLADLADEDLTIALCAEQVPCGAAAVRLFEAAGITPAPDTLEQDVRATLTKVRLGEVDAALVYRTDVLVAAGDVEGIDVPEAEEAVNDYPIVVLADAPHPDAARAFAEHVLGDAAGEVFSRAGFELP